MYLVSVNEEFAFICEAVQISGNHKVALIAAL